MSTKEVKNSNGDSSNRGGNASVALEEYDSSNVLPISTTKSEGEWVMDSSCSFHMCPTKEWFLSLEEKETRTVHLGTNYEWSTKDIRTVRFLLSDGTSKTLNEAMSLRRNLISLEALAHANCSIKLEQGMLKVIKGSIVIMKGARENGLYMSQCKTLYTIVVQCQF